MSLHRGALQGATRNDTLMALRRICSLNTVVPVTVLSFKDVVTEPTSQTDRPSDRPTDPDRSYTSTLLPSTTLR